MERAELDELLAEQTRYYRERATAYDLDMAWDSDDPDLRGLFAPIDHWFSGLPIEGSVLELACGTGAWTKRLSEHADEVHALDVAPEMVERAQARLAGAEHVTFDVADIYRWEPRTTYDVVFFSFLLSHVPARMRPRFWEVVAASVSHEGIVAFVDAAPHRRSEEEWLDEDVARRTLRDGSEHRIVKVFPTAEEISRSMADAGLRGEVGPVGEAFLAGTGMRR